MGELGPEVFVMDDGGGVALKMEGEESDSGSSQDDDFDPRQGGGAEDSEDSESAAAEALGLGGEGALSPSDVDTDSELDEEPHRKLDAEERESFLDVYHPEARVQNFEEVRMKATVKRNKGHIDDPAHTTLPF